MNILMVNGIGHKGSSWHIAREIAEKIQKQVPDSTIDEIWLPKELPHFCTGCTQCILQGEEKCPHAAFVKPLDEKLDAADVLIFSSPVYVYHCTGAMKAFLDHFAYRWMLHRPWPSMFRKQAVCVATAAGGGMSSTIRDMRDSLNWWGVPRVYGIGVAVRALHWDTVSDRKRALITRKTDQVAKKIVSGLGHTGPSLSARLKFALFQRLYRKGWNRADTQYWEKMGWMSGKKPWKQTEKR